MSEASRWISVGELAHAFSHHSNAAPPSPVLAGRSLDLALQHGGSLSYRFQDENRLSWSAGDGGDSTTQGDDDYFAAEVRPGIFFVDHLRHREPATSVSLVLDLDQGIATALTGRLPEKAEALSSLAERAAQGQELTAVRADFTSGALDGAFTAATPRHLPTSDLVGRRVEYTYSLTEQYEHIYLNEHFYTWHCLLGAERGLADTDRCHYYKLAGDLYLFVWREKIVPTLGVVVVDFQALRTTGKIFGYQGGDYSHTTNFRVGATARVVNVTGPRLHL